MTRGTGFQVTLLVVLLFPLAPTAATAATFVIQDGDLFENYYIVADDTLNMTWGMVTQDLQASGSSTSNLYGGTIGYDINAYDTCSLNVYGTAILDDLRLYGSSTANLYGGQVGDILMIHDTATANVYGYGFSWTFFPPDAGLRGDGRLTGFWQDGTGFGITWANPAGGNTFDRISLHVIPEPTTAFLLLAGLSVTATMRRRFFRRS